MERVIRKMIIISSCFLLFLFSCDSVDPELSYPTTFPSLSQSNIKTLQKEFSEINSDSLKVEINKYGFISSDSFTSIPSWSKKNISRDQVLQIAVQSLVKNKKFTNTKDKQTILSNIISIKDASNKNWWIVKLGNQIFNGIEIYHSNMIISIYAGKVYLLNNSWFPEPIIPLYDKITSSVAKMKVVGEDLKIINPTSQERTFAVTENAIGEINKKMIIPFEKENSLELRVTWQIPILYSGIVGWYIYMDTTTGEIIKKVQSVIIG